MIRHHSMRKLVVPPQTAHIVPSGTFILQPGTAMIKVNTLKSSYLQVAHGL